MIARIVLNIALFLMLTSLSFEVYAQDSLNFEDWTVDLSNDNIYNAGTTTGRGNVSKFCRKNDHRCAWTLLQETNCTKGATVPVLLVYDSGTTPTDLVCGIRADDISVLVFPDAEVMDNIINENRHLVIATPVQNHGKADIEIFRFSLAGAKDAISTLNLLIGKSKKHKSPNHATM